MSTVNLDEKVVVKNLCEWDLHFKRLETIGDFKLPRKGVNRLTRAEIQAQVYAGNKMFAGTDGKGSHAKIYIDDKDTRVLVGFEDEEGTEKQDILDDEKIKKILDYKTLNTFKKHVQESVLLQSEKLFLFEEAKRQKLNDFEKIKFIEEYTGFKFDK